MSLEVHLDELDLMLLVWKMQHDQEDPHAIMGNILKQ